MLRPTNLFNAKQPLKSVNLKEQIDKCHESYDNARKELHKYMKELLKAKVNEL
jgi:uncharacterized coiled-coil DUF342 family protein